MFSQNHLQNSKSDYWSSRVGPIVSMILKTSYCF